MPDPDLDYNSAQSDIARLIAPNVLGFYTHFEATEIFTFDDHDRVPHNVFSLLVAEERIENPVRAHQYLGRRIRLKSLAGLVFGINADSDEAARV